MQLRGDARAHEASPVSKRLAIADAIARYLELNRQAQHTSIRQARLGGRWRQVYVRSGERVVLRISGLQQPACDVDGQLLARRFARCLEAGFAKGFAFPLQREQRLITKR